jgi:hypothetical protein
MVADELQLVTANVGGTVPEIYDTEGLAEELKTPVHTIHYWRSKGTGPKGIKVGKRILYRSTDVDAWLDKKAAEDPMTDRPQHGRAR